LVLKYKQCFENVEQIERTREQLGIVYRFVNGSKTNINTTFENTKV
jgi:hypothetical protein